MRDESYFSQLKDTLVGQCQKCHGSGFLKDGTCDCLIEFRARHRLLVGNFAEHLLEIGDDFPDQQISLGESKPYLDFFLQNPDRVKKQGLSLYIWSERRGVGKTTLAHLLAKVFARYFAREENYSRSIKYRFMEVGEFFDLAKKSGPYNYQGFVHEWDATLFVLDDFGNEDRSSKWDFEFITKLIQDFLRHRTRLRLSTILTTNTRPSALKEQYKEDISSLLEVQPNDKVGGLLWREVFVSGRDLRLDKDLSPWKEVDASH